jgi:CBS domain-containing protein
MRELIDLLVSDADMLPCEAAERISVRRITAREMDRTAADIMEPIPIIELDGTLQQAAQRLVGANSSILAVVSPEGGLAGVITEWDITRATAQGCSDDMPLAEIMTPDVVSARLDEGILEIVENLEQHEISAMPVVDDQEVLGMVSSDLLARRSLLQLLQSQQD